MLHPAFASVLKSGRDEFNKRFAEARRLYPDLNNETFTFFLSGPVNRLVEEVSKGQRDRVPDVVTAVFDVTLELVGQKLAGKGARTTFIEEGWNRILIPAVRAVAAAPASVLSSLSNALHQLATTQGARPEQWIAEMERFSPECPDVETFLRLGQICAWRAGLAHYREGSLALTDTLPEGLLTALFRLSPGLTWETAKGQLLANPWYDPSVVESSQDSFKVVAEVGAFRGFGGLFVEPPVVVSHDEHFIVRSGSECWLLTANIFGATFHRAATEDFTALLNQRKPLPDGLRVEKDKVHYRDQSFTFPVLGEFTSSAANKDTVALTSACAHSILLVALR